MNVATLTAAPQRLTPASRVHAKLRRAEESLQEAVARYADLLSTATNASADGGLSILHGQGALEHLVAGMGGLSTVRREIGLAHLKLAEVRADFYTEDDDFGDDGGKPKNRAHVG